MRKTILFSFLFTISQLSFGQNIIQFKVSKPYCIFNFLETASNSSRSSSTLKRYIVNNTKGDSVFANMLSTFQNIQLAYDYKREEYPESRRQYRSTFDLIDIALVNSNTLDEFKNRIIGILPNSELQKLMTVLKSAEPYYDKLIWSTNEVKINNQLKALDVYAPKASAIFNTLNHFYNSSWTSDIPFIVSLYPIPGAKGNSTATPHANSLCVGVLADEKDHIGRVGVVLHEMCHVLYDEQPNEFQHKLEKYFADNHSLYTQYAYNFFDEGLATALGNGWAYKTLNGTADTSSWYNNEYINGFAHALYPLVESYIDENKQMDSYFIDKAVDLFAEKFPGSITDYGILLNRVTIYNDAENSGERNALSNMIGEYFQLSNTSFMTPILDKDALASIKNNNQTQLIVVDRNQAQNIKELKKIFPQISKYLPAKVDSSYNLSFLDKSKRPVIILISKNKEGIREELKKMKELKHFDVQTMLQ